MRSDTLHSALLDGRKLFTVFPVQAPTPPAETAWQAFNFSMRDVGEVAGGFCRGGHMAVQKCGNSLLQQKLKLYIWFFS